MMDGGERPKANEFSWLPPRSTVINLSPSNKRRSNEKKRNAKSYESPPLQRFDRPRTGFQMQARKVKEQRSLALKLQPKDRSKSSRDNPAKNKTDRPRSSTYTGSSDKKYDEKVGKDFKIEELADKHHRSSSYGKNGQNQKSGSPRGSDSKSEQLSSDEDTVFAEKSIGQEAFNVEKAFKSRKKSQFQPSQKFVSLCYQLSEEGLGEKESFGEGAMYAKRISSPESRKSRKIQDGVDVERQESPLAKRSENRRDKAVKGVSKSNDLSMRKNQASLAPFNDTTSAAQEDEQQGKSGKVPASQKKTSVFEMKELHEESVNINDILSRRISEGSQSEKFVSLSYEAERTRKANGPNPRNRDVHGGMYARKVRKQPKSNGSTKTLDQGPTSHSQEPPIDDVNKNISKRRMSKFVNSTVLEDDEFDVDMLLTPQRKESHESAAGEKFLSLSWQHQDDSWNHGQREGGLYAKRVRSKTVS